jgi:tripartite-type tricarboxylate transporter receptor subunit TctC
MQIRSVLALLVLLASCLSAAADPYPIRPIRMILPFPPGGGTDVVGRVLAQHMSASMGQPIVVENRAGASGTIGTAAIAKAAPDGYTFGIIISNHLVNPALFKQLPYDSVKDLKPITLIGNGLFALVVHPSVPARSLQDLIALARSKPNALNVAIASNGTIGHLAWEQLKATQSIEMTPILYKGAGPAVADVLSGQVQVIFASYPSVQAHIQAGKLRAIAVLSERRSPIAPELPTAAEAGVPSLTLSDWWGFVAPAGTSKAIVDRLHAETQKALAIPEVQSRLRGLGAEIVGNSPEEFSNLIASGIEKWGQVVRNAGIKAE